MRRLPLLAVLLALGCASDPAPKSAEATRGQAAGGDSSEPRVALSPQELRSKWAALTTSESDLATGVSSLSTLGAEEKLRRLAALRGDAGMLAAGLARLEPPPELASCRKIAVDGAKQVKQSLDAINDIWMGRAQRDRLAADRISAELCTGFAAMREARDACGVSGAVAQPIACK